ncbi:MAG: hypothetical protein DHS20C18_15540 [Saprospiraceae bacterium]|nr:MAG: hypothetical protein DHS20C18_15540 [Saprospiraceae bacterium]
MKKILLFVFLFGCFGAAQAQFKLGVRMGINTTDLNPNDIKILDANGLDRFNLALKQANYGVHGGLVFSFRKNNLMIQPEVLLNSNKVDYTITDAQGSGLVDSIRSEKYQYLDIPVLLGLKLGPLRLHGGPVGHIYINSTSELEGLDGYLDRFEPFTLGYQLGVGLTIWKLMLDVRYEGNFTKFGDHFEFFGNQYQFDQSSARFLFSIGFLFGDAN